MTIPDFQSLMLPTLKLCGDSKQHTQRETIEFLANQFALTSQERSELLPSGRQTRFDNRVAWATTFLRKAGLLVNTERGKFEITPRGLEVLKNPPAVINTNFLNKYDEFVQFRSRKEKEETREEISSNGSQTPEEIMDIAYHSLRQALTSEILSTVRKSSPAFFERLVVDVLVKMGYGGTRQDAGKIIGKSGDEGIDGIINEDRLGLDVIYIQAKKWEKDNQVGRPEIQKFAGALQGKRAKKGVFITTSSFTKEAKEFAAGIENKIILIDGLSLSQLMIDYNVGVASITSYELKRLDLDYFEE